MAALCGTRQSAVHAGDALRVPRQLLLRRLKRLLLVLSVAVPDATLPPPSLGSYLLYALEGMYPCRRCTRTDCDTLKTRA